MVYLAKCCGVRVVGRPVWIALGVPDPEDYCPQCGRWTKFTAEGMPAAAEDPKRPVFGRKVA